MVTKSFTPFPILKTARLTLRRLADSDAGEIFALRSDDSVNKYLDRKPSTSIRDAIDFIQVINGKIESHDSYYWAITLSGADKLIGTVCLFGLSHNHLKAEIGYELLPGFQGKGMMREAVSKVIDFGMQHLGLHSIDACTHAQNKNSSRLLEQLNFKRESDVDENCWLFRLIRNE